MNEGEDRAKQGEALPIPMILPCPKCGMRHVDAPEPEKGWTNPPHKSHLCHGCGIVWRPADVPTTGVLATVTQGARDTWAAVQMSTNEQVDAAAVERATKAILAIVPEGYGMTEPEAEKYARAALAAAKGGK